ncbi:NAD-binding protein (plasmid) [Rhizobium sp. 32-5/1]|uniref:FAD-dependent oxidoreductase n=1 Tax=Rhizobium sp. 32-5/1 TaxID=3019602 RepID=UPI00240D1D25|nr:FAD-dependent oxidoreductase [Rhizobium sp. 32-5/1]WEZ85913.1 NAD-binding protein [Rhizobium sp. 32-5/1]
MAGSAQSPLRLAIVGQGVAGVEVALALKKRLDGLVSAGARAGGGVKIHLVGRSSALVPERGKMARILVEKVLSRQGITHHSAFDVVAVADKELVATDGRTARRR